jgi:hypothetical protein
MPAFVAAVIHLHGAAFGDVHNFAMLKAKHDVCPVPALLSGLFARQTLWAVGIRDDISD